MVKQRILTTLVVAALLSIAMLGLRQIDRLNDGIELKKIELKDNSAKLKLLDSKYDKLNKELESKDADKQKIEDELKKLQQERDELNKALQAKIKAKERDIAAKAQKATTQALGAPQVASAATGSVEQIVRDAATKYGVNPDYLARIAKCESTFNPSSVNYNYYENGHPSGLFQHISGYWPGRAAKYGWPGASVFNAQAQAEVTAQMFRDGHSSLWECK